jgi:hypothetical protein
MADYTPVALGSKPPQAMSLADMVYIARGAQAYKQAQEINPLEVQRSATELQRLQQLLPEEVRRAKAEADVSQSTVNPRVTSATAAASTAESGAEQARLALMALKQKKIADSQISMINNPLVIDAEKNPSAANREALFNLVQKNGMTMADDLGVKRDEAQKLIQPYLEIAATDPGNLRGYFKQRHIQGLDESARTNALNPSGVSVDTGTQRQVTSTNEFSGVPIGKPLPGTAVNLQLMPNEILVQDTQGNQFIQSKDNQGRISTRPVSNAPINAPINAPAVIQNQKNQPTTQLVAPKQNPMVARLPQDVPENLPVYSQAVPPRFPVRQPGQPVFTLQQGEADAQKAGSEFLRNTIANRLTIAPMRNNLEKVMQTTDELLQDTISKSGKGLQIEQYLNKLADDSKYKLLSKSLAQLQMSLPSSPDMSTDAGKALKATATGTEVYPPEVLQKIAVQLHGEMLARDQLGQASDKYGRKFGESNMGSFTQMWSNNADAKVFELMSLSKLIKNKELREKMAERIINSSPGSEDRTIIEQKYKNIQKLIKDGTL